jgi:hypothetical protein
MGLKRASAKLGEFRDYQRIRISQAFQHFVNPPLLTGGLL